MSDNNEQNREEQQVSQEEFNALKTRLEELQNINKEIIETRDKTKEKNRELEEELNTLRSTKEKERESKLNEGDFEELKNMLIEERTARENLQQQLRTTAIENAVLDYAAQAKAINPATVARLIDKSSIEFDENGNVDKGSLENVINKFKETDAYLFRSEEEEQPSRKTPSTKRPGEGGPTNELRSRLKEATSLKEFKDILRKSGTIAVK